MAAAASRPRKGRRDGSPLAALNIYWPIDAVIDPRPANLNAVPQTVTIIVAALALRGTPPAPGLKKPAAARIVSSDPRASPVRPQPGESCSEALRPLRLGQLLDRTFSLYRRNFLLFIGLSTIPVVILCAMSVVMQIAQGPALQAQVAHRPPTRLRRSGDAGVLFPLLAR